jgi:N-acetylneuraminic acid mutarotase
MQPKSVLSTVILFVLVVSTLLSFNSVGSAMGAYIVSSVNVSIQSPTGFYDQSTLPLSINVSFVYGTTTTTDEFSFQNVTCKYSLDGGVWKNITQMNVTANKQQPDINFWNGFLHKLNATYSTVLQGLPEGSHFINVTVQSGETAGNAQTYFTTKASANSWVTKASMPTAIYGVQAAAVNGKIYVIGDYPAANLEYDPSTDTWQQKTPMPIQIPDFFGEVTVQNKIYCIGSGLTETYNPATDTWQVKAAMLTPRNGTTASVVDGKIYVIGGRNNGSLNEAYDPQTDSWTAKAPLPSSAVLHTSAALDGKIYVFSGSGALSPGITQIYNPQSDTWTVGTPMPIGVDLPAAAAIDDGVSGLKAIYVVGGSIEFFVPGSYYLQVYFPQNDSWTMGAYLPTPRMGLGVAVVNNTLYAIGGTNSRVEVPAANGRGGALAYAELSTNEQYTPGSITPPANPPPSRNSSIIVITSPATTPKATASSSLISSATPSPSPTLNSLPIHSASNEPTHSTQPPNSQSATFMPTEAIIVTVALITASAVIVAIELRQHLIRRKRTAKAV